jgi:hypothetical protein
MARRFEKNRPPIRLKTRNIEGVSNRDASRLTDLGLHRLEDFINMQEPEIRERYGVSKKSAISIGKAWRYLVAPPMAIQ